jgi:hypothetical protein
LNKPIVNYKQMKTVFEPTYVRISDLFTPRKLMDAINYLADNKDHGDSYAQMTGSHKRT